MSLRILVSAVLVALVLTSERCLGENRAASIKNDFLGSAVLMPNARRSRLSRDFVTAASEDDESQPPPPEPPLPAATGTSPSTPPLSEESAHETTVIVPQDDAESRSSDGVDEEAKQLPLSEDAVREYEHLLKMDTKNFSPKQKQLLEQIVERVARLSGGTDSPTTTIDQADAEVVGESRGSKQRLTKARATTTSSPSAATVTKAQIPKHTPSSSTSTTKSKPSVGQTVKTQITTTSAEPPKPAIYKFKPLQTNINPVSSSVATKVGNVTEVIFGNITTTSIVDSLSTDNGREDIFGKKRPPTTAAAALATTTVDANKKKEPAGPAKPTKYHYYPHNQHIYLLPECAIQQVCNAVYVRLNYTQPLCACPSRYRDPCSASIHEDDLHTTKLVGDGNRKAITLAKTCESTTEMRECRSPRDWSLLALQNTRSGKSHYLVICRCPDNFILEGPMAHDQPTYASVPGIRVFGMMCVKPGPNASNKRKPAQSLKRDPPANSYSNGGTYQTKYPSQYQQPQPYKQPDMNAYQQPQQQQQQFGSSQNYHQQQYQSNYQYLHRSPADRPLSTSTPRNMYQPMYQQAPASIHTYNSNHHHDDDQYDDVYGRHGAEVDLDETSGATVTAGDPKVTPPSPTGTNSEENTATADPTTYPTSLASSANEDISTTILATEATVTSTVQQQQQTQHQAAARKRRNADDIDAQIEAMIQQLLLNSDLASPHPHHTHLKKQHSAMFNTRK